MTQEPVSDEYYFIAPDKCTECIGFHEEPQCAAVCPVDCCVPDDELCRNRRRTIRQNKSSYIIKSNAYKLYKNIVMQSFRTEIENPIVEKDILELERKIQLV